MAQIIVVNLMGEQIDITNNINWFLENKIYDFNEDFIDKGYKLEIYVNEELLFLIDRFTK